MRPSRATRVLTALALGLGLGALAGAAQPAGASGPSPAGRAARWAPAATAAIHPGVQMYTAGAQCTANFVFTDAAHRVYVGYAAHCAGKGEATDTDGCNTASYPIGTAVRFTDDGTLVDGGTPVGRGRLAYSSWIAMHRVRTTNANACAANDLALVRVRAADVRKVNPSVPFWGGPVGVSTAGAPAGTQVYSWGHSSLRPTTVLSPKTGASLGAASGRWGWEGYTATPPPGRPPRPGPPPAPAGGRGGGGVSPATPGTPGDAGGGFLDASGRAFGPLSTVAAAPPPGSNGLGDLASELAFARRHSEIAG